MIKDIKRVVRLAIAATIIAVKGAISGIAGILPGFSGGVMMLVFRAYKPLMYTLAHPIKGVKKYWKLLLPFGIGAAIGFVAAARVLADVFTKYEVESTCLFVGLILGMFPSLFREAGKTGRTRGSWIGLIVSAAMLTGVFFILNSGTEGQKLVPNFGWYAVSGVLWGLSTIIPGLSSSAMMMSLGVYIPMAEGLGNFDMSVILPWALGLIAVIALLSRFVNYIFEKYTSIANHCIIGIVIASTVPLIPREYADLRQGLIGAGLAILGILISFFVDKFEQKTKEKYSKRD